MPKILTPVSLWNNFDCSLPVNANKLFESIYSGVKIERVTFEGRETRSGRVKIAAAFASDAVNPSTETVLILPDSSDTIDVEILKFFVKRGYSALMVDYRGEWENCDFYTQYPDDVAYANTAKCGRFKDYVDDSADKTSWYEWVAVGLYARKYLEERIKNDKIAVTGIRDGGEIAWKLGVAGQFKCIIPVCAAGWISYRGISKYVSEETTLDEERYRFIAGIDSQAYAPYVKCPVLMLCSTNDPDFDYDRAYDTFSRINPEFISGSAISYSMKSNASISASGTADMFLMLDKTLKNRQVFIPKSAEITVEVDSEQNLIVRSVSDNQGTVEDCQMYLAEDCIDSSLREWSVCPEKKRISLNEREFYLNIYEKTTTIFVLCSVRYANGFVSWSKIVVKKISGKFKNMQPKCRVMYSDKYGTDGFSVADFKRYSAGGIFLYDETALPQLVVKAKGVKGLYSECGLASNRFTNPRFSPIGGNVLSIDLFCDTTSVFTLTVKDLASGENYVATVPVTGGVWQSTVLESKLFKNAGGVPLNDFTGDLNFELDCPVKYAVNNIMWL